MVAEVPCIRDYIYSFRGRLVVFLSVHAHERSAVMQHCSYCSANLYRSLRKVAVHLFHDSGHMLPCCARLNVLYCSMPGFTNQSVNTVQAQIKIVHRAVHTMAAFYILYQLTAVSL